MTKKALLANDTSNWYHYGCTATSLGIKESLEELDWKVDRLSIVESYNLKNIPGNLDQFNEPVHFKAFKKENNEIIERLSDVEHLIINGEGTLHGLKPVTIGLLYLAHIAKHQLHKKVSIINHSCYPLSTGSTDPQGLAERLYAGVYGSLDFVAIREPLSLRHLERIGVSARLAFDCMPLTISRHNILSRIKPKQKIVLAGSVSFNEKMLKIYTQLINVLKEEKVPVEVLTGAAANPATDEGGFISMLSQQCPTGWKLVNAKSLDEWFNCIGEAQLLISGRFHHTIAATCLGTPFICFESNTPKISGILELFGQEPPLSTNDPEILEKVFRLVDARFAQRHEPEEILKELGALARNNFIPFQ